MGVEQQQSERTHVPLILPSLTNSAGLEITISESREFATEKPPSLKSANEWFSHFVSVW